MTLMPRDANNKAIPVLRLDGKAHQISFSNTPVKNDTAFASDVISLTPTSNCHVRFGDASVPNAATTDHYLAAGVTRDIALGNGQARYTYLSVIRATADGVLHVSERS